MSMFTRDKPESTPTPAPAPSDAKAREKASIPPQAPVNPPQAPMEMKRMQATAQPITNVTTTPRTTGVSVISKALKITGQLESTEDIQIEGEVDGDVRGVNVKVGANAKVKGTVYGDEVELSGTVDGKIEAKRVILTSTARMSGDVVHQDITIQSGAFMDGHCRPEFGKVSDTRKIIPVMKQAGE